MSVCGSCDDRVGGWAADQSPIVKSRRQAMLGLLRFGATDPLTGTVGIDLIEIDDGLGITSTGCNNMVYEVLLDATGALVERTETMAPSGSEQRGHGLWFVGETGLRHLLTGYGGGYFSKLAGKPLPSSCYHS